MEYSYQHMKLHHILPANQAVARVINHVRVNNIVKMTGYLVKVQDQNGEIQASSLSQRTGEEGGDSVEYFWVESIKIMP